MSSEPVDRWKRSVFLAAMLPFMGFGWLDNSLMLLFGDTIDRTFCVSLGFSTMAAAALGNAGSDVAGVFASSRVEKVAGKFGFGYPELSDKIQQSASYRKVKACGAAFGVFIGCLLGMWPLLGYDPKKGERQRIAEKQREVFKVTVDELCRVVHAKNGNVIWLKEDKMNEGSGSQSLSKVMDHVSRASEILNIQEMSSSPFYDKSIHDNYMDSGHPVKSLLCVPIVDFGGRVIGAVELANKAGDVPFTDRDEDVVAAVCSHIASELTEFREAKDFREVIQGCAKNMMNAPRKLLAMSESQRIDRLFNDVLAQLKDTFNSEASMLLLVDKEKNQLVSRSKTPGMPDLRSSIDEGIMGRVARTGRAVLINDLPNDLAYDEERYVNYKNTGINVQSVLCHPIFDSNRTVIGVIEVINKKGFDGFTDKDNNLLKTIASHIALNLEGQGSSLKKILKIVKDQHIAADARTIATESTPKNINRPLGLTEPARIVCHIKAVSHIPDTRNYLSKSSAWSRPNVYFTLEVHSGDPKKFNSTTICETRAPAHRSTELDVNDNLVVQVQAAQKMYCVVKLWQSRLFTEDVVIGEFVRSVDGIKDELNDSIQEITLFRPRSNGNEEVRATEARVSIGWSVLPVPK